MQAAGFSTILPLAGTNSDSSFAIEGRPSDNNSPSPDEERREVSPDYFRALGTPLIRGRFFTDADKTDAPLVIIVNQTFAKKFWPNEDALGKRIVMGGMSDDPKWITIVGIVGDMRHFGLDIDPKPEMYVPFAQSAYFSTIYVVTQQSGSANFGSSDSARNPGNRSSVASGEVRTLWFRTLDLLFDSYLRHQGSRLRRSRCSHSALA